MNKITVFLVFIYTLFCHSQNKNNFDNTFLIQISKMNYIDSSNFNFEYKNFIFIPFNKKIKIKKVKRKSKNDEKLIRFLKKKGTIYDLILIDQYVDRSLSNYLSERNKKVIEKTNFICLDNFGTLYQDALKIYKLNFKGEIETINIDDYHIQSTGLIHADFSEINLKTNNRPKNVSKVVNKKRVYVTRRNKEINVLFIYNITCDQIIKLVD